jgi:hypothetical protein
VGRGVSVYNIKGFAQKEELIWITHGYGFALPIMAREVSAHLQNPLTDFDREVVSSSKSGVTVPPPYNTIDHSCHEYPRQ